jgi:hypothetical protein
MRSSSGPLIVLDLGCYLTHLLLLSCATYWAYIVCVDRLLGLDDWLRRLLLLELPDGAADVFTLELMHNIILSVNGELVLSFFE